FNRKISQLSIGDVQDVTVTQKGVLAHLFNYGTLVIETAGEQQNYLFTYIPDPYKHSKLIVGAHEKNLVQYGN
ncbi:PH domain-containing protein, partial [Candidatus Saccharibacteria bacterium]|nr:PH domain-containing protein [Candidatus Saccharibacteria bacterium]